MESQLQNLFENLKLEMQRQTIEITKNIMEKMDEQLKPIVEENRRLKQSLEILENKMESQRKANNLIIFGLQENEKSNLELIKNITTVFKDLDVDLDTRDINQVKRVGKREGIQEKSRPVVVSLVNNWKKYEILKNKKKNSQFYITEDFPKKVLETRRSLQNKLKEEREKGNYAVIKYDRLVVKEKGSFIKRKRTSTTTDNNDTGMPADSKKTDKPTSKVNRLNAFDFMRTRSNSLTIEKPNKQ